MKFDGNVENVLDLINFIIKTYNDEYRHPNGDNAEIKFMQGDCYYFAMILSKFYPDGKYYINKDRNHIAYKIGDNIYDVTGLVDNSCFREMDDMDWFSVDTLMLTLNKEERRIRESFYENFASDLKRILDLHLENYDRTKKS